MTEFRFEVGDIITLDLAKFKIEKRYRKHGDNEYDVSEPPNTEIYLTEVDENLFSSYKIHKRAKIENWEKELE